MIARSDWLPLFNARQLTGSFLLTGPSGEWAVVSKETYKDIHSALLPGDLHEFLERLGLILTESNANQVLGAHARRARQAYRGPSLFVVATTTRCNLSCDYCQIGNTRGHRDAPRPSAATARRVVEFAFQTPSPHVTIEFQGGEPLLEFGTVAQLVELAKEKAVETAKTLDFVLTTNLLPLSEAMLGFLAENRVAITVSLDGPEEIQTKHRFSGKASNWNRFASNLDHLTRTYPLPINGICVVRRESLGRVEEILEAYVSFRINSVFLKPIGRFGSAARDWTEVSVPTGDFLRFWSEAVDALYFRNDRYRLEERFLLILLQKALNPLDPNYLDLRNPCGAIIGQLAFDTEGNVFACDNGRFGGPFHVGSVHHSTLRDVIDGPKATALLRSTSLAAPSCLRCAYRPFCGTCLTQLHAAGADLSEVTRLASRCQINKGRLDLLFSRIVTAPQKIVDVAEERRRLFHGAGFRVSCPRPGESQASAFTLERERPLRREVACST